MTPLTPKRAADFTRWNRAGLDRFRYTSKGAAEFTELLRIAHLILYARGQKPEDIDPVEVWRAAFENEKFPDGMSVEAKRTKLQSAFSRQSMDGVPPPLATYREKLLAQYQASLTDPSAQISRAFAEAMHVLSETLDAYANEGTLRTATQTEHALALLSLIGFQPSPASSAVTPIAYQLKSDQGQLTLPVGTAFDYPLPEGGPNLTFEALDAIVAHPSLNAMLPVGHDSRTDDFPNTETKFKLIEGSIFSHELAGSVAVIEDGQAIEGVRITAASSADHSVTLSRRSGLALNGKLQTASLAVAPDTVWSPRPLASNWVHFVKPPETFPNAIVFASYAGGGGDFYRVDEVRGRDMRITNVSNPVVKGILTHTADLFVVFKSFGGGANESFGSGSGSAGYELRGKAKRNIDEKKPTDAPKGNQITEVFATKSNSDETDGFTKIYPSGTFLFLSDVPPVYVKKDRTLGDLDMNVTTAAIFVDGASVDEFSKYEFLALKLSDGSVVADRFDASRHDVSGVSLTTQKLELSYVNVQAIYAGFGDRSDFVANTQSQKPLIKGDGTLSVLCADSEQDMLRPGRIVLLVRTDQSAAVEGTITEVVEQGSRFARLRVDTGSASTDGFEEGNTLVHANVATFGHGKSLPPRVLGSGDAGQLGQTMKIEEEDVSTRLNPGFPGGVAADIQVTVGGRLWQQVSVSGSAGQDRPTYSVIQQSDGSAEVKFHQRLPSGTDNVMLSRIRTGAGADGNRIPAFGVTNLQPKNSAVEAVVQPIRPQAGADRQGVDALRKNGKSRYALFDRALGVRDFARLAESHNGVLHAGAELVKKGLGRGGNIILLTVVPAGGSDLGQIEDQLETMLLEASIPGTVIDIRRFNSVTLAGTCSVQLKAGYADIHSITDEIQARLTDRFGIEARPLGQVLYVSEIAAVIEGHTAVDFTTITLDATCGPGTGVECETAEDETVQALRPDARTSVYLDGFGGFQMTVLPGTTGGSS